MAACPRVRSGTSLRRNLLCLATLCVPTHIASYKLAFHTFHAPSVQHVLLRPSSVLCESCAIGGYWRRSFGFRQRIFDLLEGGSGVLKGARGMRPMMSAAAGQAGETSPSEEEVSATQVTAQGEEVSVSETTETRSDGDGEEKYGAMESNDGMGEEDGKEKEEKKKNDNVKVHHTTVALIPPDEAWSSIQAAWSTQELRAELKDKGLYRWPPHINLLYPFVPERRFAVSPKLLNLKVLRARFSTDLPYGDPRGGAEAHPSRV
eukprot:3203347-Rhodomonas_salina.1